MSEPEPTPAKGKKTPPTKKRRNFQAELQAMTSNVEQAMRLLRKAKATDPDAASVREMLIDLAVEALEGVP